MKFEKSFELIIVGLGTVTYPKKNYCGSRDFYVAKLMINQKQHIRFVPTVGIRKMHPEEMECKYVKRPQSSEACS